MRRAKVARRRLPSPAPENVSEGEAARVRRGHVSSEIGQTSGLRERKKARLRQQIVETALHLFRQRGYETHASTTSCRLWKSASPRFFVISPAKKRYCAKWDAVRSLARPKA